MLLNMMNCWKFYTLDYGHGILKYIELLKKIENRFTVQEKLNVILFSKKLAL